MRSIVVAVALLLPTIAVAGPDAQQADRLFDEGRKLKEAGDLKGACAKFEEALQNNRNAVGTILNVALCDAEAGKVATAFKLFTEASERAAEQNLDEHHKAAEEQIAKLKGQVPVLAVAIAEPPADAKLVIDDQIVAIKDAGRILIDPGSRTIVLTAPGRLPYQTKIEVVLGQPMAITIPKLRYPTTGARKTVGKIFTLGGAGLAVTGVVVGLVARSNYRAQFQTMPGEMQPRCSQPAGGQAMCDANGQAETKSAINLGWVGTIVGIGGIAALGVGTYLWFFGGSDSGGHSERAVSVVPTLGPDQAGLSAFGRF
jgi:hypothetical protein